jgi:hypothetical protein
LLRIWIWLIDTDPDSNRFKEIMYLKQNHILPSFRQLVFLYIATKFRSLYRISDIDEVLKFFLS